jgi:micrococcal nuclease
VERIIDGDTIVVTMASGTETVRLLNIDTPETVHPTEPVECFGPEASAAITEMIPPGTELHMTRDTEARDTFGRLLAHVHRAHDDLFVNLEMVRLGYADVLVIAPNDTLADRFRAARAEAREHRRGLWEACGREPPG